MFVAAHGQPPWADRGGDRNRQNRDAACSRRRFRRIGVPVFMADVKGDLSGIARPGGENPKIRERYRTARPRGFSICRLSRGLLGSLRRTGTSGSSTISEMGPLLLSRLLNLNETQSGVLTIWSSRSPTTTACSCSISKICGRCSNTWATMRRSSRPNTATFPRPAIGAIQRGLLALEEQGGDKFFGEPALNLEDLMQTDGSGPRGESISWSRTS